MAQAARKTGQGALGRGLCGGLGGGGGCLRGLGRGIASGLIPDGLTGTALTQAAFSQAFGGFGPVFIAICMFFFAFSTIIGWYFFGQSNFKALFGEKALPVYSVIVVVFILVGSTLKVDLVWAMADFFNGLMAVPNLLALLALSGVVAAIDKE